MKLFKHQKYQRLKAIRVAHKMRGLLEVEAQDMGKYLPQKAIIQVNQGNNE